MNINELANNKNWSTAFITYTEDSFDKKYTEKERTYRVSSKSNYFDNSKISKALYGDCLDDSEHGVRLDYYYDWKIEKITIEKKGAK